MQIGTPIDQQIKLKPAKPKDFSPIPVYIAGGIVIAILLYSDARTVAESLLTGYPKEIPYFIAFGIVGAIDLIYFGMIFAAKQLFAWKKIAMAAWAFYLAMAIVLGCIGFYSAVLVVNHIDALGSKQRRILNPYDFSQNPALTGADREVAELSHALVSVDSIIFGMARASALSSQQASMFAGSLKKAIGDTGVSNREKRDLTYYAGRANRSNADITTTLNEMQKDRWRISSTLLAARQKRNAIFDSLTNRFAGRSAEDVIEADMGLELKRGVATMTQFGVIAVLLVIMMIRAAHTGELQYNPIKFVPASPHQTPKTNGDAAGNGLSDRVDARQFASPDDFVLPAINEGETKHQYQRRVADMWNKREFPDYVSLRFIAGRLRISPPRLSLIAKNLRLKRAANSNVNDAITA